MGIFGALSDSHLSLGRISEQEIGKRITGVDAAIGIHSPCVVRIGGIEIEMKKITAEPDVVTPVINRNVVIEFEIAINTAGEARGVANRGELVAK